MRKIHIFFAFLAVMIGSAPTAFAQGQSAPAQGAAKPKAAPAVTAIAQGQAKSSLDASLLKAADTGDLAAAQQLLRRGANANTVGGDGETPLINAALHGHADVVKALLAAHAHANALGKNGSTPLIYASQNGHADVVKLLLASGADVNAVNDDDDTSLTLASPEYASDPSFDGTSSARIIRKGYPDVVQLLLAAGAKRTVAREFTVAVAEVAFPGREIPVNADLANLTSADTPHIGKVVLAPATRVNFGNLRITPAPDLKELSIDGRDLDAVQEPINKGPRLPDFGVARCDAVQGEKVSLRTIVVHTRRDAETVVEKIKEGQAFATVSNQYSVLPTEPEPTGKSPGLAFTPITDLRREYQTALSGICPGGTTGVIELGFRTTAWRLATKRLGTLTAVLNSQYKVTLLLLTHEQIEALAQQGK